MPKKTNRAVEGMVKFFNGRGRGKSPRPRVFSVFSPKEMFQIIQLLDGRDAHDLAAYVNVHKTGSKNLSLEDVQYVANLFCVKEVQDS